MTIDAHDYVQHLDYNDKDTIPNDLLCLVPSPIILGEKGSILRLTQSGIERDKSFVTQIRFFIQITNCVGTPIVKNIRVNAEGDSKERIIKIETLFTETPFDSTCLVTLSSIFTRFKIVEKKIEVSDFIKISGKLLSYINEKPFSNTDIIVALNQKKRHEMNSQTQECRTSDDGSFEAKFSENDLMWKDTSFWVSFHYKISEEVSIEYDYMNSHNFEKFALMASIFFDSVNL